MRCDGGDVGQRAAGRRGRVWRSRYHSRALRTPTETRRGLVYVLLNFRKHLRASPGVDPRSTWNKSISGGGSFTDMTYYDGIALSRGDLSNDAEVNPSVDAVEEFKLVTNNYSAEYAHALGAITSFTMKSGTNLLYQIPLGQGHKLLPDGAAGKNFRRLAARPGECVQQRQPLGGDRSEYAAFL